MIRLILADDHAVVRKGLQLFIGYEDNLKLVGEAADGDALLNIIKENEAEILRERRATDRRPFTRPVIISAGRDRVCVSFSRDLSPIGVGLISQCKWREGETANLTIHCVSGRSKQVIAEVRWCRDYGKGWFLSGWKFLRDA